MTAPTELLVGWLVSSAIFIHLVCWVAHTGTVSALWVAACAVSVVVPIWSPCTTGAVSALLAVQVCAVLAAGWRPGLVAAAATHGGVAIAGVTLLNYLVWAISYVMTDPATPSGATLLFTAGASVALGVVAEVAWRITAARESKTK